VLRSIALLSFASVLMISCGPDHRHCSGPHPDFVVVLELSDRPLPSDTVVHVTYAGSGTEDYVLAAPSSDPEVVFCYPSSADGGVLIDNGGAAGASGDDASSVQALRCELWTGGFSELTVHASGVPDTSYDLSPDDSQCTVSQVIVLDSPDAG
jgi:hypothetical protein